jgi:hypothetical protein
MKTNSIAATISGKIEEMRQDSHIQQISAILVDEVLLLEKVPVVEPAI